MIWLALTLITDSVHANRSWVENAIIVVVLHPTGGASDQTDVAKRIVEWIEGAIDQRVSTKSETLSPTKFVVGLYRDGFVHRGGSGLSLTMLPI
jgi:hypothetical protein